MRFEKLAYLTKNRLENALVAGALLSAVKAFVILAAMIIHADRKNFKRQMRRQWSKYFQSFTCCVLKIKKLVDQTTRKRAIAV
jgi:hypothetical protein